MKKHDFLSVLITFVVGLFAGSYLYTTGLAELIAKYATPDAESVMEMSIVADSYGGCRNTCPSFQITNDGSYRYYFVPSAGAEKVLRQGTLPSKMQREIKKVLVVGDLVKQSKVIQPATCNSYVDGIDVKYKITLDNEVYIIDSCGTAADSKGKIWTTLSSVWKYFETAK